MSEHIDKLKEIGLSSIHKTTHIPREYIEAILNGNFEVFNKVQFLGFIAILQREYGLDLEDFKTKALEVIEQKEAQKEEQKYSGVFVSPKKRRNFTPLYIGIAIAIFVVAVIYSIQLSMNTRNATSLELNNNKVVESVIKNLEEKTQEQNVAYTQDTPRNEENTTTPALDTENNRTQPIVEEKPVPEIDKEAVVDHVESFEIKPRARVWLGYINLRTHKHHQKTFRKLLRLDPTQEWLLHFGHGYVNIVIDGEVQKFKSRKGLRFHYKDGKIEKISKKEFTRLNRGRAW